MHPSAGHASGTLVNAVLFHCGLPAIKVVSGRQRQQHAHGFCEEDESVAQDVVVLTKNVDGRNQKRNPDAPDAIRPGIVHRLDKGTTGLIVVAKDAPTHAGLCEQFAARTVRRRYLAIVLGTPDPVEGRVRAPIGRDPRDRLRMAVVHRRRWQTSCKQLHCSSFNRRGECSSFGMAVGDRKNASDTSALPRNWTSNHWGRYLRWRRSVSS